MNWVEDQHFLKMEKVDLSGMVWKENLNVKGACHRGSRLVSPLLTFCSFRLLLPRSERRNISEILFTEAYFIQPARA